MSDILITHSGNISALVRLMVRDSSGVPTAGQTVSYIVRDSTGASVASANMTDLPGAPGWYVPSSFVLSSPGIFTIEYTIPATFVGVSEDKIIVDEILARSYIQDEAFIDREYRFNLLFTDQLNAPLAVTTPEIEIYHYDSMTGGRTVLTPANEPLLPLVPVEIGRLTFVYTVPASFVEGDILYAEVTATDSSLNGMGLIRYDYLLSLRAVEGDRLGTKFVA